VVAEIGQQMLLTHVSVGLVQVPESEQGPDDGALPSHVAQHTELPTQVTPGIGGQATPFAHEAKLGTLLGHCPGGVEGQQILLVVHVLPAVLQDLSALQGPVVATPPGHVGQHTVPTQLVFGAVHAWIVEHGP
jgi:hypothetical protein